MDIMEKLKEVLASVVPGADLSGVTEESRLGADLGINSLKMLQLAILLEDALNVRFTGSPHFETVGDVMAYIRGQMTE